MAVTQKQKQTPYVGTNKGCIWLWSKDGKYHTCILTEIVDLIMESDESKLAFLEYLETLRPEMVFQEEAQANKAERYSKKESKKDGKKSSNESLFSRKGKGHAFGKKAEPKEDDRLDKLEKTLGEVVSFLKAQCE